MQFCILITGQTYVEVIISLALVLVVLFGFNKLQLDMVQLYRKYQRQELLYSVAHSFYDYSNAKGRIIEAGSVRLNGYTFSVMQSKQRLVVSSNSVRPIVITKLF